MLYQNLYELSLMDNPKVILQEMVTEITHSGLTAVSYLTQVYKNATTKKTDTVEKFIARIKAKMNFYSLTFTGKAVKDNGKKAGKKAGKKKANKKNKDIVKQITALLDKCNDTQWNKVADYMSK